MVYVTITWPCLQVVDEPSEPTRCCKNVFPLMAHQKALTKKMVVKSIYSLQITTGSNHNTSEPTHTNKMLLARYYSSFLFWLAEDSNSHYVPKQGLRRQLFRTGPRLIMLTTQQHSKSNCLLSFQAMAHRPLIEHNPWRINDICQKRYTRPSRQLFPLSHIYVITLILKVYTLHPFHTHPFWDVTELSFALLICLQYPFSTMSGPRHHHQLHRDLTRGTILFFPLRAVSLNKNTCYTISSIHFFVELNSQIQKSYN
jgi:hypothetical protein